MLIEDVSNGAIFFPNNNTYLGLPPPTLGAKPLKFYLSITFQLQQRQHLTNLLILIYLQFCADFETSLVMYIVVLGYGIIWKMKI